jgi:hypothetical protein
MRGGEKTIEVEVMNLPWSLADLKYLFERSVGESIDERKFRRWRKLCFIRQGRTYRPFDLAKLLYFAKVMQKFNNCKACQQFLVQEMRSNVEFWDWARGATARDWFERFGLDCAS